MSAQKQLYFPVLKWKLLLSTQILLGIFFLLAIDTRVLGKPFNEADDKSSLIFQVIFKISNDILKIPKSEVIYREERMEAMILGISSESVNQNVTNE